MKVDRNNP
ncbi:Protein of unknown function [Pyronema omphalodes CBS 100304]|uniref:Uncharacterized protein n=1 Tax=Pyronema omphalodes (strain CBS 100304) TaxID=1076935 RepID=U4LGW3_PYROM|nr:Protein of unknown function [Pyronema omphalodes CBS 100304]